MVAKIFPVFIVGIFLSVILAAIMSTADSQLLVTASYHGGLYRNKIRRRKRGRADVGLRGCVMAVAIIAVLIATNQNSTILGLVSLRMWGGFGSAFRSLVLCSLFWRRTNKQGAYHAKHYRQRRGDLVWAQLSGGILRSV